MENKVEPSQTEAKHKKDILWQIWVPLILGICIAVAVAVFTTIATSSANNFSFSLKWANISTVFLTLIAASIGLFTLFLFILIIALLARLIKYTPIYAKLTQSYVFQAAVFIFTAAEKITAPIIKIHGWKASVDTLKSSLTSTRKQQEN